MAKRKFRELSPNEVKLFMALDPPGHWVNLVESGQIVAPTAYDILAKEAFCANTQGPAVEALRRALNYFHRPGGGWRATDEFESTIEF